MKRIESHHHAGIGFDWVYVRELRFADNMELVQPEKLKDLQATLGVETKIADDRTWCRTSLRMTFLPSHGEAQFQVISASVEGQFTVSSDAPSVDLEEFATKQAPAILMPFLRDAIATATSRSRFGQVLVPPLNVVAIMDEMKKAQAKAAEAGAGDV